MNTDPIWTVSVSAFDGERYASEHTSDLTMGQMEERALSAYQAKDYPTAEKRFLNLIRCGLGNSLQHENNLALVFMRTDRYEDAIDCIEKAMTVAPPLASRPRATDPIWEEKRRHWANAHYNLGKAYEALNDLPAAWKHYHTACKLLPTDDRKATLKWLAEIGVDTKGYDAIW